MNKQWQADDFQKDFHEKKQGAESTEKDADYRQRAKKAENDFEQWLKKDRAGNAPKQEKPKHKSGKRILTVVIIVVLVVLLSGIYVVPEGKMAYVTQFGKITRQVENSGLHFHIPLIERANFINNKIMVYDVNPSEVLTADKKAMIVDSYALWKVSDATQFIRTVSGSMSEMERRIDASVYSNIKNLMGSLYQSSIISDEESSRNTLNQQVTKFSNEELENYGIEVLRVEIKLYDLPSDNLDAVYSRMISERQQMAAAYKADGEYEAAKMRNETDKTCTILIGDARAQARRLEGEGEAEYMKTLEKLYGQKDKAEFYKFMLEMDALGESLQGETTLVLGSESFLGRLLSQTEGEE